MCGIVGILGRHEVAPLIVEALKRLEYRGYDSAGIATLHDGRLARRRAVGKLVALSDLLVQRPAPRPRRHRPHPLGDARRADRAQRPPAPGRPGRRRAQRHHRELPRAARRARGRGRGLRDRDRHRDRRPALQPRARRRHVAGRGRARARWPGSTAPLRSASCSTARTTCSSPPAAARRSRSATATARSSSAPTRWRSRRSPTASPTSRRATTPSSPALGARSSTPPAARPSARSTTSRSRTSSPRRAPTSTSWPRRCTSSRRCSPTRSTATSRPDRDAVRCRAGIDFAAVDRVVLVACGTAHYACQVAKYWFEGLARLPVEIEVASEFRYREPPLGPGTLGLFVSQSGETADTLAALRYVRGPGRPHRLGRQRRELDHRPRERRRAADPRRPRDRRRLDQGLHLPAHRARRAGARRRPPARPARRRRGGAPGRRARRRAGPRSPARSRSSPRSPRSPATSRAPATCSSSAAAPMYPLALEGALKLKEISYIHAEGYASGELKHGPIALIDEDGAGDRARARRTRSSRRPSPTCRR